MIGVTLVNHVGIACGDLDRTVAFYRTITGREPNASGDADSEGLGGAMGYDHVVLRWATMRLDNINLDLLEFEVPEPDAGSMPIGANGALHLCFECTDVDAVRSRLEAEGFVFDGPTHDGEPDEDGTPGLRLAYFTGPDGEHLELIRPTGSFLREAVAP